MSQEETIVLKTSGGDSIKELIYFRHQVFHVSWFVNLDFFSASSEPIEHNLSCNYVGVFASI